MGYELKMYVGIKQDDQKNYLIKHNKQVYTLFNKEINGETKQIFYPDGNTLTYPGSEDSITKEKCSWFQVISMLDLCGCHLNTNTCEFKDLDNYLFSVDDGNKIIAKDKYGQYHNFIPISKVIIDIKEQIQYFIDKNEKPYRRYLVALYMLESIREQFPNENVGCTFYGH